MAWSRWIHHMRCITILNRSSSPILLGPPARLSTTSPGSITDDCEPPAASSRRVRLVPLPHPGHRWYWPSARRRSSSSNLLANRPTPEIACRESLRASSSLESRRRISSASAMISFVQSAFTRPTVESLLLVIAWLSHGSRRTLARLSTTVDCHLPGLPEGTRVAANHEALTPCPGLIDLNSHEGS